MPSIQIADTKLVNANIALFDNAANVNNSNLAKSEFGAVQAALTSLGDNVATFTDITTADVSVIPELENTAVSLSSDARQVLRHFLADGGPLVLIGSSSRNGNSCGFLNNLFSDTGGYVGFHPHTSTLSSRGGTLTADATGTAFVNDSASLPANTAVQFIADENSFSGALRPGARGTFEWQFIGLSAPNLPVATSSERSLSENFLSGSCLHAQTPGGQFDLSCHYELSERTDSRFSSFLRVAAAETARLQNGEL